MANVRYTKEMLAPIVAESTSWAQVARAVGIKPFTGAQSHLKSRCEKFGLDSSHFLGQASNKGKSFNKIPLENHLVKDSTLSSHKLRKRLIAEGYKKAECETCGLTEWNGKLIPLELDHINSDHWDNRIDNLQIVCPNCHAQHTVERRAFVAERKTRLV